MTFRADARCGRCRLAMLPHPKSYQELEDRLGPWQEQHAGSAECKRTRRRWLRGHVSVAALGILPITTAWAVLSGWAKDILRDLGVDVGSFWFVSIALGVAVAFFASRVGVPLAERFLEERKPCHDCAGPSTSWATFDDLRLSSPWGAVRIERSCGEHGANPSTVKPAPSDAET